MNKLSLYIAKYFFTINALADISVAYTKEDIVSVGMVRAVLYLIAVLLIIPKLKFNKIYLYILLILLYMFILILNSSDFQYSLYIYIKVFIGISSYFLGNTVFRENKNVLKILHNDLVRASLILVGNFIVSLVFGIGEETYIKGVFTGNAEVQFTYLLVYSTIFLFFYSTYSLQTKKIDTFIILINILTIMIVFRRGAIIAIFSFILLIVFFSKTKKIKKQIVVIGVVITVILSLMYNDNIQNLFQKRTDFSSELSEGANRFTETAIVLEQFSTGNWEKKLFGNELFNSKSFLKYFMHISYSRTLHVDYNIILSGGGIIGLLLFLLLYYKIFSRINRKILKVKNRKIMQNYKLLLYGLFLASIILSASNQLWIVSSYTSFFFLLGVIDNKNNEIVKNSILIYEKK